MADCCRCGIDTKHTCIIASTGLHEGYSAGRAEAPTWGVQTLPFSCWSRSLGSGSARRAAKLGVKRAARACRAAVQGGVPRRPASTPAIRPRALAASMACTADSTRQDRGLKGNRWSVIANERQPERQLERQHLKGRAASTAAGALSSEQHPTTSRTHSGLPRWVAGTSFGMMVQQRASRDPRMSMPPDRVSSSPFNSDETHGASCSINRKRPASEGLAEEPGNGQLGRLPAPVGAGRQLAAAWGSLRT
ncbi:MAG: hypothetical protein FRX49_09784 [Trebouxia sp. A1-2]|nr:MAG: hypothetical protein FRX49_09784 [Trebouxia sp. A1-2]